MNKNSMNKIKIMPDYHCSPLWSYVDNVFCDNLALNSIELSLGPSLQEKLERWQQKYDRTLDQSRPQDSGFPSPEDENEFEDEGLEIWKEMMRTFPQYKITYFSVKDYNHYKNVEEYLKAFPYQSGHFK